MEINHFGHDHPLILSEEKHNSNFPCGVCGEPILGLSYCCRICPYVLHKWCSDLPRELSSHKHHLPDHPLVLTPQAPSESSSLGSCKICKMEIKTTACAYKCIAKECCSFNLHVECASLPGMINFEINHKTNTILYFLRKYQSNCKCIICGCDCFGPLFFSWEPSDTRYLHVHCAMLPRKVKHTVHLHDLNLRPPLDEKGWYFEFFCDACEQERNPDAHIYYCEPCEFVAHIGCGVAGLDRPIQDILGTCTMYEISKSLEQEDESSKPVEQKEDDFSKVVVEEYQENEEDVIYFGHEHALALVKYQRTLRRDCHVCHLPVSGLTYSCMLCDLHLHKCCAQLPEKIQHWMHPEHKLKKFPDTDQLLKYISKKNKKIKFLKDGEGNIEDIFDYGEGISLIRDNEEGYLIHSFVEDNLIHAGDGDNLIHYDDREFYMIDTHHCAFCFGPIGSGSKFSSFYYKCKNCNFEMHDTCAMIPRDLKHQSHEHYLCLYEKEKVAGSSRKPTCQACRFPCEVLLSLECQICDFYLHVQCFLLPYTGKHTAHRHDLNLTYSYKEDPRALEYFCDLCEKPRIPNRWVYCCPDPKCYIVAHTNCVFPNPFIPSQLN